MSMNGLQHSTIQSNSLQIIFLLDFETFLSNPTQFSRPFVMQLQTSRESTTIKAKLLLVRNFFHTQFIMEICCEYFNVFSANQIASNERRKQIKKKTAELLKFKMTNF